VRSGCLLQCVCGTHPNDGICVAERNNELPCPARLTAENPKDVGDSPDRPAITASQEISYWNGSHCWSHPLRQRQRPNGSRLSCGRTARGRKELEPQTKTRAREATQFLPTCERPTASSAC